MVGWKCDWKGSYKESIKVLGANLDPTTYNFPEIDLVGIGNERVGLTRLIVCGRSGRLDSSSCCSCARSILLIWDVPEDFLLIVLVILGRCDHRLETWNRLLKLAQQVENAGNESWLVHGAHLHQSLHESLDPRSLEVGLKSLEEEVEVHGLL